MHHVTVPLCLSLLSTKRHKYPSTMSQNVAKCKVMYTMYTNQVRCILGDLWMCPFVSPKKKTDTAILRLRAAPTRRRSNNDWMFIINDKPH